MPDASDDRPDWNLDSFDDAVAAFRRLIPMTDEQYAALETEAQALAFTVANVSQADIVQQVYDAIDSAIKNGTTLEDFKAAVEPQLTTAWGEPKAYRVETIFRTNTQAAYNQARFETITHPVVKQARPYLRFDGIDDSRQSDICRAIDHTVLPADDPFWHTHAPILHHQCRSVLTPLSKDEADTHGITQSPPEVAPEDGFGNPYKTFKPDVDKYDPSIKDVLGEKLK